MSLLEGEPEAQAGALVVGYLKAGKLRESGGEYTDPPLPFSNNGQGPIVGFRVGRSFHGILPGGFHTPESSS